MGVVRVLDGIRPVGEVHLTTVAGSLSTEDYLRILNDDVEDLGGRVLAREVVRNLVTNTGRSGVASRVINGGSASIPTYWGIGTSAITPSAADTSLTGETTNRQVLSVTSVFATYYMRFATTYSAGSFSATVRGVALFTSSSGGNMWAIAGTNTAKSTSQSLVADWRLQVLSA